jgi:hypothetical protein
MVTSLRLAVVVGVSCLAVLIAGSLTPAHADDVAIPIQGFADPVIISTDGSLVIPPATDGVQVNTSCVDVPGIGRSCIGHPVGPDLVTRGLSELSPLVKHSPEAQQALGWIAVEGEQALSAIYGVPNDGRIAQYGRPELRDYVVERLLNIIDKKVYSETLTDDEQKALAFLESQVAEDDRVLAQAAWDEFERFQDVGCGYRPPTAPPVVTKPVVMPDKVVKWCSRARTSTYDAFVFAPPVPKPADFMAWGAYRSSAKLGLDDLGKPVVQDNLRDIAISAAAFSAPVVAVGAAALTGNLIGSTGLVASTLTKIMPHAARITWRAGGQFLGGGAAGALAGAIIAAVVVVFLVVTAVAIYLLIEHEAVGQTLRDHLDTANEAEDPLGLEELIDDYEGQPFMSSADPTDPDPYRSDESVSRLMADVVLWTTVNQQGTVVPDPEGLWPDAETDPDDVRFERTVEGGTPQTVNQVTVPTPAGTAQVRFDDRWMIVKEPGKPERARLSLDYLNTSKEVRLATLAPPDAGGLIVNDPSTTFPVDANQQNAITYLDGQARTVRARVLQSPADYLDGPRPSAVGPLFAGRPVILRPNPVQNDGATYPLEDAQTDFTYEWDVDRFDAATGTWQPVLTSGQFGPSFTPTQTGTYSATVTMTPVSGPVVEKSGVVDFAVASPPISTPVLDLIDNGSSQLELDLQVTEPIASDTITIDVTWPRGVFEDTDPPPTTVVLPCQQTGPLECTTPRTGLLNNLIRALTVTTDLRLPVSVTITNGFGGAVSHVFGIDDPARPTVAPPPPDANVDLPGSVLVTDASTVVTMPLAAGYSEYVAATLLPGEGEQAFNLVDPVTGNTTADLEIPGLDGVFTSVYEEGGAWYLSVWGNPGPDDVGTYEVPVVVSEAPSTNRALAVVVVNVTPSAEDRFRGGIEHTVDPNDLTVAEPPDLYPTVFGGRTEWPRYAGGMCVKMVHTDNSGPTTSQRCGPVADFVGTSEPTAKLRFPEYFPDGLLAGSYQVSAWLTTPDDTVDVLPLQMSFLLADDVSYLPPRIELERPAIGGRAIRGNRLRAVVEAPQPPEATLTYAWLRDGTRIRGADGRAYRLRPADVGHRISVRVTATAPDWRKDTETSPRTRRVRR